MLFVPLRGENIFFCSATRCGRSVFVIFRLQDDPPSASWQTCHLWISNHRKGRPLRCKVDQNRDHRSFFFVICLFCSRRRWWEDSRRLGVSFGPSLYPAAKRNFQRFVWNQTCFKSPWSCALEKAHRRRVVSFGTCWRVSTARSSRSLLLREKRRSSTFLDIKAKMMPQCSRQIWVRRSLDH